MKTFLTLCFVLTLSISQSMGQCQIPNGDFEQWEDLTADFEAELGIMLAEEVIAPSNYYSTIRALAIGLSDIIIPFFDTGIADRPLFASIQRAEPGASGTGSALQISGDTLFQVTDLITNFGCGERPISLKGFYRYSGIDNDEISIGALFHTGEATLSEEDAVGAATFTAVGGSSEFTEFEVPINYVDETSVPDSVLLLILTSKDESSTAETFFQIDDLSLTGTTTSTADVADVVQDLIAPNPVGQELQIISNSKIELLQVFNMQGQMIKSWNQASTALLVNDIPHGSYLARGTSAEGVLVQKFIKL